MQIGVQVSNQPYALRDINSLASNLNIDFFLVCDHDFTLMPGHNVAYVKGGSSPYAAIELDVDADFTHVSKASWLTPLETADLLTDAIVLDGGFQFLLKMPPKSEPGTTNKKKKTKAKAPVDSSLSQSMISLERSMEKTAKIIEHAGKSKEVKSSPAALAQNTQELKHAKAEVAQLRQQLANASMMNKKGKKTVSWLADTQAHPVMSYDNMPIGNTCPDVASFLQMLTECLDDPQDSMMAPRIGSDSVVLPYTASLNIPLGDPSLAFPDAILLIIADPTRVHNYGYQVYGYRTSQLKSVGQTPIWISNVKPTQDFGKISDAIISLFNTATLVQTTQVGGTNISVSASLGEVGACKTAATNIKPGTLYQAAPVGHASRARTFATEPLSIFNNHTHLELFDVIDRTSNSQQAPATANVTHPNGDYTDSRAVVYNGDSIRGVNVSAFQPNNTSITTKIGGWLLPSSTLITGNSPQVVWQLSQTAGYLDKLWQGDFTITGNVTFNDVTGTISSDSSPVVSLIVKFADDYISPGSSTFTYSYGGYSKVRILDADVSADATVNFRLHSVNSAFSDKIIKGIPIQDISIRTVFISPSGSTDGNVLSYKYTPSSMVNVEFVDVPASGILYSNMIVTGLNTVGALMLDIEGQVELQLKNGTSESYIPPMCGVMPYDVEIAKLAAHLMVAHKHEVYSALGWQDFKDFFVNKVWPVLKQVGRVALPIVGGAFGPVGAVVGKTLAGAIPQSCTGVFSFPAVSNDSGVISEKTFDLHPVTMSDNEPGFVTTVLENFNQTYPHFDYVGDVVGESFDWAFLMAVLHACGVSTAPMSYSAEIASVEFTGPPAEQHYNGGRTRLIDHSQLVINMLPIALGEAKARGMSIDNLPYRVFTNDGILTQDGYVPIAMSTSAQRTKTAEALGVSVHELKSVETGKFPWSGALTGMRIILNLVPPQFKSLSFDLSTKKFSHAFDFAPKLLGSNVH